MMDTLQTGVINIIKAALTGQKHDLPEDFDLEAGIAVAKKHQISALFYYGVLACGLTLDPATTENLFQLTCQLMAFSTNQSYEISRLFQSFDKNKVDYMPLKGTILKKMYPKTEMRIMSDADILIRTEQYEAIKAIMVELGYTEKYESDHEFVWKKGKVFIELHKHLIPSYNKDYYAYYGDGWRLGKPISNDSTHYTMAGEDEFIYIFTHFAKHYRDAGVGIKHILDIWVYKDNKKNLNEEYILSELKKLQLDKFYKNVMDALEVWFNNGAPTEQTELITRIIFDSGVYGTHINHILSEAVKSSKRIGTAKKTKFVGVLQAIFLPYSEMILSYGVLRKIPVLLPVMWVVRWFEAIFIRKGAIKARSQKLKIMASKNISNYQDALTFVGLDFNFK